MDHLLLRRLHRITAMRIVREYRTVSHASATVLAASPPWELRALVFKKRYEQRDSSKQAAPDDLRTAEKDAWDQWRSQLISETGEHRGTAAVLPNWGTWRSRGLPLTYRMIQILTGHGVFGDDDICHHCGEGRDTSQHTLKSCPAWELPRYTLRYIIGERLSPSAIIAAMLSGPQEYEAVCLFCERVILAKERAEREKKRNSHPCKVTRWRRMTVRRPRAPSSPPQRTAIRTRDGARGNGLP
ncbi:uncharacterized protein LOC122568405 [Bombus pyrosoma]|uniref:uncharacterized protein LOC122568405 n=1 Tax=Bombus pyrosoma TaxID=396416 RepID=UPI001CB90928|nr:uncharacterized protein LOC122568405 [Bombus pyrosoma]